MLYSRQASGECKDVAQRLEQAAGDHQFGVLGVIDLKQKMTEKGVPFASECIIIEVCNPQQARKVLERNPEVSTSLPCRISVYEDGGRVMVATVKPSVLLQMYEGSESIAAVAGEVEKTLIAIIDESCAPPRA
jgi:uncharacterized protein (DUF302 family)